MEVNTKFNPYGDISEILQKLKVNSSKQTLEVNDSNELKCSVASNNGILSVDTLAQNCKDDDFLNQISQTELSSIGGFNSLHRMYSCSSSENKSKLALKEQLQMEAKLASKNQKFIPFKLSTMSERLIIEMKGNKEINSECTTAPNPVGNAVNQWKKCYKRHSFLDIHSNETIELRPTTCIEGISRSTIMKVLCSLLNTGKHSVIYFGVNEHGIVDGINITKKERDSFRVQLDVMIIEHIRPMLMPSGYEVIFNPVLHMHSAIREIYSNHCRFMIEIHLHPVQSVLYTLSDASSYMRKGDLTYLASMHDVRKWIAKHEEDKYIKEFEFLEMLYNKMMKSK